MFDVWNLKYTYCGSVDNTKVFRHDYIDHFDPACVSHVNIFFLYFNEILHLSDVVVRIFASNIA